MPEKWQIAINDGIKHYKSGRYQDSLCSFQEACRVHTDDPIPNLYRALALRQQYVPGGKSTENVLAAWRTEAALQEALRLDPDNWPALVLMGQMALDYSRFDEARWWYRAAQSLDPADPDLFCTLGTVAWQEWRATGRGRPDLIRKAVRNFGQALDLDPKNLGAMRYLAALVRDGANVWPMLGEWDRRVQEEKEEVRRQMEAGFVSQWPPALAGTWQIVRDMTASAVRRPAPPPPPPRPSRAANDQKTAGSRAGSPGWTFRHIPRPDGKPHPLLMNPAAQAKYLISKVEPDGVAGTSGVVRLDVTIGLDGGVDSVKTISGPAALTEAAIKAVSQWKYQPVYSNWEAVEVRTEVRVEFAS